VLLRQKLLRTWRWRLFWWSVSTFRLSMALSVSGCWRRATLLPLLLLRRLMRLWRRRLTVSGTHPFSLGAQFLCVCPTRRRRDLLMNSGRRTAARLPLSSCTERCRRAEPHGFVMTLRRSLSCPTLRGIRLFARSSRWRATMLLLLRRCTLETLPRCYSPSSASSGQTWCGSSHTFLSSGSSTFNRRGRKTLTWLG